MYFKYGFESVMKKMFTLVIVCHPYVVINVSN